MRAKRWFEQTESSFHKVIPLIKESRAIFCKVTRKYFCVRTIRKKAIYYDRTNTASTILDNYAHYKRLFAEFGTVVLNFGLHNKELQMDAIQELLERLFEDFLTGKTAIIWRETAPQHFKNPCGVYSPDA